MPNGAGHRLGFPSATHARRASGDTAPVSERRKHASHGTRGWEGIWRSRQFDHKAQSAGWDPLMQQPRARATPIPQPGTGAHWAHSYCRGCPGLWVTRSPPPTLQDTGGEDPRSIHSQLPLPGQAQALELAPK